ncbi:MAG: 3-phosphoshikimate 1-carboxyvinyltransferase [Candidatus Delongbacteria bacterium]|nr:3-phosphoshikimate 1-carboxyvinyltransferase [Candidatus Delongbacteria bacterium]MBN2833516.1 3-phosphoshikimate 1-carboxyvinyltransferase [Candidatus Delongbacteria bacterium]
MIFFKSTISGQITAPTSKSYFQRVVAISSLIKGKTTIVGLNDCEDCKTSLNLAKNLGSEIIYTSDTIIIYGKKNKPDDYLNCGESGLSMRMYLPIASTYDKCFTFDGKGSLLKRPLNDIPKVLRSSGIEIEEKHFLPINLCGGLKAGKYEIDGSKSSQFLTGMLIALSFLDGLSEIIVKDLNSKPYIDLTLEILKKFGIKIITNNYNYFKIFGNPCISDNIINIDGDWSSASSLIVASSLAGDISIKGLRQNSFQADEAILKILDLANVKYFFENELLHVKKATAISPFVFDATDCPDLFPVLSIFASQANGTTKIKGVNRLKNKESDRGFVLVNELKKLGVNIKIEDDLMVIQKSKILGGVVNSYSDHRIAMTAAIAGLISENGVEISDPNCVDKSYPNFYKDIFSLEHKY